jgi:serpin B
MDGETVDAFRLAVANALWGREGFPFADDYLSLLEDHYGAGLRRADFAGDPEGARRRINDWVEEATEDRIEDLLPPDAVDPSTVLVLANAIFFKAGWESEFDPEDTESATFTALDGTESTVPTMRQNLRTNYASVPGVEAVELPYVGGSVSMVLLLPEEGTFREFERNLTAGRLFGVFEALGDSRGDVRLPRFEFDTEVQLSKALSDLGMPDAFGPEADFGGMVEGGGDRLLVDEVYHEAFVSVDEEGTEAAAATAAVVVETAAQRSFEVTFDRPFLFCIRDRPTDAVLFLGRVVDAGAAQ